MMENFWERVLCVTIILYDNADMVSQVNNTQLF